MATQIKIPETVSAEGLRCRAEIVRRQGDESCARHLELAADKIEELSSRADQAITALADFERRMSDVRLKLAAAIPQRCR